MPFYKLNIRDSVPDVGVSGELYYGDVIPKLRRAWSDMPEGSMRVPNINSGSVDGCVILDALPHHFEAFLKLLEEPDWLGGVEGEDRMDPDELFWFKYDRPGPSFVVLDGGVS